MKFNYPQQTSSASPWLFFVLRGDKPIRGLKVVKGGAGILSALCLVAGCALGPDYRRPAIDTPSSWRVDSPAAADLANTSWWQHFQDPVLDELIRLALQENKDLRMAALRVQEFDARLKISRAGFYPQFGYAGAATRDRFSEQRSIPLPAGVAPLNNTYQISANMGWELDIWGRIRRANEAALAELLAAEESRRGVLLTLVADVASAYTQLLAFDKGAEISQRTLKNRAEGLRILEIKFRGGQISKLELAQARSAYEEAAAALPAQQRHVALWENALSVLLGQNPRAIKRANKLDTLVVPPVPQGIPSDILVRRPDVRQAEQEIIAANARIGVAQSRYLPSISLTGLFGYASTELSTLLENTASFGSLGGGFTGPLFSGGRIKAEIEQTKAIHQQTVTKYRAVIQNAFREVEDALISYQKSSEQLIVLARQVSALQEYLLLASKRHEGGYSNYIDVLDAERSLYAAEIKQAQTQTDVYLALIAIYKAMGGGWLVDNKTANTGLHQLPAADGSSTVQPQGPAGLTFSTAAERGIYYD